MKRCTKCGESKPLSEFSPDKGVSDGHASWCRRCKADVQAAVMATVPAEDKAAAARAYRAGMRKHKCAVCGVKIKQEDGGLCDMCQECVDVLGGLEGLKRAVRAVRYLSE